MRGLHEMPQQEPLSIRQDHHSLESLNLSKTETETVLALSKIKAKDNQSCSAQTIYR